MNVKAEYWGTEGVPGDTSMGNTIGGTKKGRYIYMGRPKTGSSNEVLATEVLMISENVLSWVCLTPLLGVRRVGIFVSEPISLSFSKGWREAVIEVIGFRNIARDIHSIGTVEWN